jgi:hypothetical protein
MKKQHKIKNIGNKPTKKIKNIQEQCKIYCQGNLGNHNKLFSTNVITFYKTNCVLHIFSNKP